MAVCSENLSLAYFFDQSPRMLDYWNIFFFYFKHPLPLLEVYSKGMARKVQVEVQLPVDLTQELEFLPPFNIAHD